jgi:predicted transcriptional regulator
MPLGIVSDQDFEVEIQRAQVIPSRIGRGNTPAKPDQLRNLIAEEAIKGASAKELSESFGVSPSSISAYKNGSTSTASYDTPDRKLANHIVNVKDRITKKATNRLARALDSITPEKLDDLKVKDAAQVAKDMSVVIKNMTPEVREQNNNVNFVIFAPKVREESDYDVIDAVQE